MNKPIVVTGHPYAFPHYFKVFEHMDRKDDFVFVLPKLWLAKRGKVRVPLELKPGFTVYGLNTVSYGGHGIRGLFKGFLPGIFLLLPYARLKFGSRILYSCSESNLLTTLLNGLTAKILGMKYIFFTWQNIPPERYMSGLKLKMYIFLVKFNLRLADGVICGNTRAQNIIQAFRSDIKTIVCPLSGVDTEKFRPGISSNWKERLGGGKIILFCGALDSRKGLDILMQSFRMLNPAQDTKLVIAGTGPERENLVVQAQSLGLKDAVIFLDWIPHDTLPALLNSADIFVYPSVPSGGWEEQFGYSMAEASACGIPVVTTRTGSIGEVVKDGETGILVPPKDSEALASAIQKILTEENLGLAMGRLGREYIHNAFSHSLVASKISEFLQSF